MLKKPDEKQDSLKNHTIPHRSYQTNIYCLYLIKLSKWLMLIMPVVVLFYNENGLGTYDIYLLQAIYSVSVAIFEIPSGYMADIIGRKKSLIIGSILGTIGFIVQSSSFSLQGFITAQMILGLGGSFISGSDSALLYDSLAAMKRQNYYLRYEGRITSLGHFAETAAAVAGGLLAAWFSYRFVYAAQAVIASIAIPASLLLIEPVRERLSARPSVKQIIGISYYALFKDKKLSSTIFISSVAGLATLCMAWTCQIYFVTVGFSEIQITPLWVILNLTVAFVSAASSKIIPMLGSRKAILLTMVVLPLSYILIGVLPVVPALFAIYLFYMVRGYMTPMLRDIINQNCSSQIRATVLSIRSLLVRLSFSIAGPAIGFYSAQTSFYSAMIFFGVFLFITITAATTFLLRVHPFE